MNRSEAGKLGAIASAASQQAAKEKRVAAWKGVCKNCNAPIPYEKRAYSFCSHKCAGIFNNGKRRKPAYCLYCGAELPNGRKYCSHKCQWGRAKKLAFEEFSSLEDLTGKASSSIRKFLIARDGYKCSICGITEWRGEATPVIMDHIDGNADNNHASNLRLVCPNCNAQLPTFAGRNYGNGRYYRRERYKNGQSF